MIDRDERAEQIRQTVFAIIGILIVAVVVVVDVKSELKFTEDTRQGLYERASQNMR